MKKMAVIFLLIGFSIQNSVTAIDTSAASLWTTGIGSLPDSYIAPITTVATIAGAVLCAYKWGISQSDSEHTEYMHSLQNSWLGQKILNFCQYDTDALRFCRALKNAVLGGIATEIIVYNLTSLYSASGGAKFALWWASSVLACQLVKKATSVENWAEIDNAVPHSGILPHIGVDIVLYDDKETLINAAYILQNAEKTTMDELAKNACNDQLKTIENAYEKIAAAHAVLHAECSKELLKEYKIAAWWEMTEEMNSHVNFVYCHRCYECRALYGYHTHYWMPRTVCPYHACHKPHTGLTVHYSYKY
ncbi:MAG TPA: hypothetical protein VEK38_01555 [Candidatus Bathyarchaeia archaeon]|nr:hypothetical protein [Candidatus Bathyarchaeia archaeon]